MKALVQGKKILFGVVASMTVPFMAVSAAPVVGPNGLAFYSPPPLGSGSHGDLVWYRDAFVNLGDGAPKVDSWNVLYRSTDSNGLDNAVTGTVIVPESSWDGSGTRPIISYAVGTHGMSQECAPSIQLSRGTDYEAANIIEALNSGYAVLVSDNPGYLNNDPYPAYMVGEAQAHAALDIIEAAKQIPGRVVSGSADAAIWGYSQGGQTAAWAAEIEASYAPEANIMAIAAGGIPADLLDTAFFLDGSTGESFLLSAVIGLWQAYPNEFPVDDLVNSDGERAIETAGEQCVFESLFELMNDELADYTLGNKSLTRLLKDLPDAKEAVELQTLGSNRISVPLYAYHGEADEFIPLETAYALSEEYCERFDEVTFDLYPGEHIITQFQAAPFVLDWITDRFAGVVQTSSCDSSLPAPESVHNEGGGNFNVSLDAWHLNASMGLKTLRQTVQMPTESFMTANADMTDEVLTGHLFIPEFTTKLSIFIPLDVTLNIEAGDDIEGDVSLDDEGILRIEGSAYVNIGIPTVGLAFIKIPFGCRVRDQVEFPLNFEGPISSLGNGGLVFSGTTTFSSITGCGIFSPFFTVLMSGSGQTFEFILSPPDPITY